MTAPLASGTLEISFDPLSVPNASATWTDISDYLTGQPRWNTGKAKDLDEPRAGTAMFPLENDGRFTPEYADGAYYPNLTTPLRLRWTVADAIDTSPEGIWYVTDWGNEFGQVDYHEVEVTAVDGFGILSLDMLPSFNPPDAVSRDDVVALDEPFGYWRLDEEFGTKAGAVTGPDAVYVNSPTLGVPSLILGDRGTAMRVTNAVSSHIRIPIEERQLTDQNAVSVEVWVRFDDTGDAVIVAGPENTGTGLTAFALRRVSNKARFEIGVTGGTTAAVVGTTTLAADTTYHLVGTWDGRNLRIYVNGLLEGQAHASATMLIGSVGKSAYVGAPPGFVGANGTIDDPVLYEYAVDGNRILSYFESGSARGFATELAGERISTIADNGLWSVAGIQAGHHEVAPIMLHGQPRLEEILAAVKAEWPQGLFYFDGDGDPVYLGWEFKATGTYNTVQATFGDGPGEVGYEDARVRYDNEIYNVVTIAREGGLAQTAIDQESSNDRYPRFFSETGLLHTGDAECLQVANAILEMFSRPRFRVETLTLIGVADDARAQILTRRIGDLIRVKRRAHGTNPAVDIVTHIIGIEKTMEQGSGLLTATYSLARGFNAADGFWRLGIVGFSELGQTTVVA